jgi:hypothetical protein
MDMDFHLTGKIIGNSFIMQCRGGIMKWGEREGFKNIVQKLRRWYQLYPFMEKEFEPCMYLVNLAK